MVMSLNIFTVDSFTEEAFAGNPAAVCPLTQPLSDDVYQKVALEFNLSETAFVLPVGAGSDFQTGNRFTLRWFTPTTEVPLCGHATLATAHILFKHFKNVNSVITFETLSGELRCVATEDGSIEMDFPEWDIRKLEGQELERFNPLVAECVGNLPVREVWYAPWIKKVIAVLDENIDRNVFESLRPNTDRLHQFDPSGERVRGLCITMRGSFANGCVDKHGTVYDMVARYFAPWMGIAEDPVTGSLYCALAPYWAKVLMKTKLYARQCSRRGGIVNVEVKGDGRVYLRGKAVTVIRGQIMF